MPAASKRKTVYAVAAPATIVSLRLTRRATPSYASPVNPSLRAYAAASRYGSSARLGDRAGMELRAEEGGRRAGGRGEGRPTQGGGGGRRGGRPPPPPGGGIGVPLSFSWPRNS